MTFEILLFLISLVGLLIATYTDLKERIIPNKLTYSLIGLGLIINLAFSFFTGEILWYSNSLIGGVIAFGLGYLLWKTGVWAGGDVKLLTGLATLNPINFGVLRDFFGLNIAGLDFSSMSLPIFCFTLFIFSVFSMLPFAMLISISGILKNKKLKDKLIQDLSDKLFKLLIFVSAFAGLDTIIQMLNLHYLFVFLGLIALGFLKDTHKPFVAIILLVLAVIFKGTATISYLYLLPVLFFVYFLIKLYFVSVNEVLKKDIRISELEDGMISDNTITKIGSKIVIVEKLTIGKVINYLKNNNLKALTKAIRPKGEIIVNSLAGGVTVEQIEELKKLVKQGKLKDKIRIKESTAFVPAILIAYIILQIIGDLLWNVIL